jgi:hypothetical protein
MRPIAIDRLSVDGEGSALRDRRLVVLVGLTGCGKTTALRALGDLGCDLALLPDRRAIVDRFVLGGDVVRDREERFRRTARFREEHPGGVAEVVASLRLVEDGAPAAGDALVFDGLRGLEEVRWAAERLDAFFVVFDCPDVTRVERLVERRDAFDGPSAGGDRPVGAALAAIEGIERVFSRDAITRLEGLAASPDDVVAKTRIVVSERRSYDSSAALDHLRRCADPSRVLAVDTAARPARDVARGVFDWLGARGIA